MDRNGYRAITHRFPADCRREGAGTHITRWFVPSDYALTDPFLLFDETKSDRIEEYAGGFPEHPHRGFEALTYIMAGSLRHRDSAGFSGYVGPNGTQWLTNASGLTHDEVPDQTDGLFWCLQLWINLPAANKMDQPFYKEFEEQGIPELELPGGRVRVVAGEFAGTSGPLPPQARPSKPVYLDVRLEAGGQFSYTPPEGDTVLMFVAEGCVEVADESVDEGEVVLLDKKGPVQVDSERGGRFLLMAGCPIGEDIAWHGPFVLNTEAELAQAFEDFASFGPFRSDAGTGMDNSDEAS